AREVPAGRATAVRAGAEPARAKPGRRSGARARPVRGGLGRSHRTAQPRRPVTSVEAISPHVDENKENNNATRWNETVRARSASLARRRRRRASLAVRGRRRICARGWRALAARFVLAE